MKPTQLFRILALFFPLLLFASPLPALEPTAAAGYAGYAECPVDPVTGERVCCRVCSKGKACGNSCIARWKTCHRGAGCACDAGGGYSSPGTRPRSGARSPAPAAPSESVREVQRGLTELEYYSGSIDGLMGPRTRAAVREFQRDHGLDPDGIPGPATRAALRTALASRG